jgi:predicted ATP-grasp superfamily ATP-dependent carboligase
LKIIVTDGNTRAALAITRALGRENCEVIVGAEKHPCLASESRFCAGEITYPDPLRDYAGFLHYFRGILDDIKPDVLLPVTDVTTMIAAEHKDSLKKYCAIPFPDYEAVQRAADKSGVMKLAKQLDIPVPRTLYVNDIREAQEAVSSCSSIGYPVVIKPSRSRVRTGNVWKSHGVKYADDEGQLRRILRGLNNEGGFPVLLQERIIGDGVGLFLLMDAGATIAAFAHRRLREKPPSGGVSVLRESMPIQPQLKEYSERLLKALNWQGIAMVEFKQDRKSGRFMLMEINGRFWGSLQLAIDAGVNFPVLLTMSAMGEKIAPVHDYRIGVKSRWFWGDVDALLSRLFKSAKELQLPPGHPGRLKTLFQFLKLKEKNTRYEVLDMDDIKPWLYETRCWFSGIK